MSSTLKMRALGSTTDHEDVGDLPSSPLRISPSQNRRGCLRHLGCRRARVSWSRGNCRLRWYSYWFEHISKSNCMLSYSSMPLRDGEEKPSSTKISRIAIKTGDRQHRARLIVSQDSPSERDPRRPVNTAGADFSLSHRSDFTPRGRNFLQPIKRSRSIVPAQRSLAGSQAPCLRPANTLT